MASKVFEFTLWLAAGTLRDSVLREAFADALAYVGFLRAETSSPLVTVSGSLTPVLAADGRSLSFALGTIVNADVDPTTTETITFTYRSIVRNVAAVNRCSPSPRRSVSSSPDSTSPPPFGSPAGRPPARSATK